MRALFTRKRPLLIGRSLLFQGILSSSYQTPNVKKKSELTKLRSLIERKIEKTNIQLLAFSFGFHTLQDFLTIGLIGVNSKEELQENLILIQNTEKMSPQKLDLFSEARQFIEEKKLYNPSTWDK